MSSATVTETAFEISDVTGQKVLSVSNVPEGTTVSDLIQGVVGRMRLPLNDSAGRPLSYHARHDREGRHLQGSDRVAESIRSGDRIVLQPNVDAGGGAGSSRAR